jgi:hypothetical protein
VRRLPLDAESWIIDAAEQRVAEHRGRRALYLREGFATVAGTNVRDGTFAFDVALTPERGFPGGAFRVQDDENFEWFYVRPHQSGNPDATQYTPCFNGLNGWQLYHGERYAVPVAFAFDGWTRIRIDYLDDVAEVSIGDPAAGPVLRVDGLKRPPAAGTVGLADGGFGGAWYSNVEVGEAPPALRGSARAPEPADERAIHAWRVSAPFSEELLGEELDPGERTWTLLEAEPTGLADLARAHGLRGDANTVLARATIRSARAQSKRLDLGFSDRVRAYLNGRLLFAGDDGYRSRDYRFLGSIGWWDALWLPLREGENELVLAVTESFGGWGVQARFADLDGIELEA